MNINMKDKYIPGTRVSKDEMHGITGKEFLDKIFFMSDGIMPESTVRQFKTGLNEDGLAAL